ncbi:MAG: DUF5107 domain-containing protein [Spirochaetes bacterium]|nr:DUF5107 domain-containing protein [Spirochaetota bacterium]
MKLHSIYRIIQITIILLATLIGCSDTNDDNNSSSSGLPVVDPLPAKTIVEGFIPAVGSSPTIVSSSLNWQTWNFNLNPDNSITLPGTRSIVATNFNTIILENEYVEVTLLPEYGGRIVSILYKPTGHEQLYQNPVGTPYGVGANNFYYNWLMVYSGIFPTFPEPEHGKTWFLAWSNATVVNTADQISVKMSFRDTINYVSHPWQFNNGITDMTCEATVSIYKGRSYVDLDIKLINNQSSTIAYEYWTCTTLTPGSTPGDTKSPQNSEMVVPISQIKLKNDWWPWMGSVDNLVSLQSGGNIYEYKNIAHFGNWSDMGIGYAYPSMAQNWWGVINHDNEMGILRIADNSQYTPGLKFWTWGYSQSYAANPLVNPTDEPRPYIELWAGNSTQFFNDAYLTANETKSWKESYISTVGLSKITDANQNAAIFLATTKDSTTATFTADFFTTLPDQSIQVYAYLLGSQNYCLTNMVVTSSATNKTTISIPKPVGIIPSGSYQYQLTLETSNGSRLLQTSIGYTH